MKKKPPDFPSRHLEQQKGIHEIQAGKRSFCAGGLVLSRASPWRASFERPSVVLRSKSNVTQASGPWRIAVVGRENIVTERSPCRRGRRRCAVVGLMEERQALSGTCRPPWNQTLELAPLPRTDSVLLRGSQWGNAKGGRRRCCRGGGRATSSAVVNSFANPFLFFEISEFISDATKIYCNGRIC